MASLKRLLVCGGTGFLGRRICEQAVAHGWAVTSLSRSGAAAFEGGRVPKWAESVKFESFDISKASPDEIRPLTEDSDAVVYSLGILLESNYYKTFAKSQSPLDGVSKVIQKWNRNPLKHRIEDEISYELMNRDLAVKLAKETSASAKVEKPFLFVSAAGEFPGIPQAYFKTKQQAEQTISTLPSLRPIFLRPGFMFDPSSSMTMTMAVGLKAIGTVNEMLGGNAPIISRDVLKPLSTSVVAGAAVQAIESESVTGVINRDDMIDLARQASFAT
ncbi:hypothetical protein BZA70DRAFT_272554 [Myxozyma melibiosi]|uniref:NAD-dependent epimerase/dehydratase domain-containing protein n=1 Tax=Myxozyma melibiosi TaxID=54550 RepID=A0ABR1FDN8_9ASCO